MDSAIPQNLLVGVVSGITTVLLIACFQKIWSRIVLPWYENHLYQGPEIEGSWSAEVRTDAGTNKHNIKLSRTGYRIEGSALCVEGPLEGQVYSISGYFNNLLLTGQYSSKNRRRIERGAFTLMLVEDGFKLKGHLSFYDNETNSALSVECEWLPMA